MKKVELTIEQAEFVLDVARRFENFIQIALFIEPEWKADRQLERIKESSKNA